ncbi:hypothetical protein KGH42_000094 [Escherichia coli]|nr:hypothetical protein [Escherichia coli]EHM4561309.1 hypothetical protein [Escherichia coli]EIM3170969.1 hypothetical protein [Escherichia coli]
MSPLISSVNTSNRISQNLASSERPERALMQLYDIATDEQKTLIVTSLIALAVMNNRRHGVRTCG